MKSKSFSARSGHPRAWATRHVLFAMVAGVVLGTSTTSAMANDDNWPCEVALCLANPQGPTAVSECLPPIKRAWKAWAKGKKVPECHKKNADNSDGGELRASGTYIETDFADPNDPSKCPFPYRAGRERILYCAFTGVTNQYVDGALWGRIWYGGPGGVPYIEMLHVDPDHPRAPDGFENAWAALKKDIEDKSDYAALAYKVWEGSEARAVAQEKIAAAERTHANEAQANVMYLESWLPGEIEYQKNAYQAASKDYNATNTQLQAAMVALAKNPKDAAAAAQVSALTDALASIYSVVVSASNAMTQATNQLALLPSMHAQANLMSVVAAQEETKAADLRSTAINDKRESDAAEDAAKPLPAYGDGA